MTKSLNLQTIPVTCPPPICPVTAPTNSLSRGKHPCFNGMKIELEHQLFSEDSSESLNPYSNGMKIELSESEMSYEDQLVLILILME